MSKIIIIVAEGKNHAIGREGKLLWHLPDDLKFFKRQTLGAPVIMGRKTFESIGKPLPGRRNIILSRSKDFHAQGIEIFPDIPSALSACEQAEKVFIAGGGEIYRQAISFADELMVTRVDESLEADAFFPTIDEEVFELVSREYHPADEKHIYSFSFDFYERRKR